MKKFLVFFLILVLALSFIACGNESSNGDDQVSPEMPADLKAFVDAELDIIASIGEAISGDWADKHVTLVEEDGGMDDPLYSELKAVLDNFRVETGAYYVYAMIPGDGSDYYITVDGSEDPDDWMTAYDFEVQFREAWEGETAAARSGWDDDVAIWSAFAPVYDSNGDVVAIIGTDMPCEVLEDYPEWNRDRDEWNGIEE